MIPFDGGLLEGPVHPLDLPVGPGMIDLGEPVLDIVSPANTIEDVAGECPDGLSVRKLNAIVGQDDLNGIRYGFDEIPRERCRVHLSRFVMEFNEDKFRGSVNGHEHIELAVLGAHFGDVDMKIANRI